MPRINTQRMREMVINGGVGRYLEVGAMILKSCKGKDDTLTAAGSNRDIYPCLEQLKRRANWSHWTNHILTQEES